MDELRHLSPQEIEDGIMQVMATMSAVGEEIVEQLDVYPGLRTLPYILEDELVKRGYDKEQASLLCKGASMAVMSLIECVEIKAFKEEIIEPNIEGDQQ